MNIIIQKTRSKYKKSEFVCFYACRVVDSLHEDLGSLTVCVDGGINFVKHVEVEKPYRKKGIATKLYKEAINDLGSLTSIHNSRTDVPDRIWKSLSKLGKSTITEDYITVLKK